MGQHFEFDAGEFAFAFDESYPFEASLWLLEDETTDEWFPVCLGYLEPHDEHIVFVGGSTLGDEGDALIAAHGAV